jgi:hypothetical protein
MMTPAGIPEDIEAGATWFGERWWNWAKAKLEGWGATGKQHDEQTKKVEAEE